MVEQTDLPSTQRDADEVEEFDAATASPRENGTLSPSRGRPQTARLSLIAAATPTVSPSSVRCKAPSASPNRCPKPT